MALGKLGKRLDKIVEWLKRSWIKVNKNKNKLCIFHRNNNTDGSLITEDTMLTLRNEMNVLGITFDSKLQWNPQISHTKKWCANISLQAIRKIKKYFTTSEIFQLQTTNFYSRLYYSSEIWQLPTLNQNCKKILLSAFCKCFETLQHNIWPKYVLHWHAQAI